jgi:replicative DNA helicase
MIGGILSGEFIILAGNSGVGKSIFAFNWALANCSKNKILFVSGEMENSTSVVRFLQDELSISTKEINEQSYLEDSIRRNLIEGSLQEFQTKYGSLDFYNRSYEISVAMIEQIIKDNPKGYDVIFIDHLKYIKKEVRDEWQAIDRIVTSLQQIGQRYKVTIVLLAHFVKSNDADSSTKPQPVERLYGGVSLLRESTKILQIWHPVLWGDNYDPTQLYTPTRFLLMKNRYGSENSCWVKYNRMTRKYEEMEQEERKDAVRYRGTFSKSKNDKMNEVQLVDTVKEFTSNPPDVPADLFGIKS